MKCAMVLAQLTLWLVVVCSGGGTIVFVFQWWYLMVVDLRKLSKGNALFSQRAKSYKKVGLDELALVVLQVDNSIFDVRFYKSPACNKC
ncbi:hypothetical protein Taro_008109 [Colocasia esculenta]|uniref:Uncharacterized protein n=1 Tax=Colocasia esculenta TaxID=4460 RepID=A0A843TWR5_COLES|nr:hypothetical protein [Colocasia esculenta]